MEGMAASGDPSTSVMKGEPYLVELVHGDDTSTSRCGRQPKSTSRTWMIEDALRLVAGWGGSPCHHGVGLLECSSRGERRKKKDRN